MDTVQKVFARRPVVTVESVLPKVECTNPDLIVGLELEIEDVRFGLNYNENMWRMDRDGSLRPAEYSFEFISLPMKLSGALAELGDFFKKNNFKDRLKHYSDRTSVHVHTNVLDFTQEQVATLALVYTVMEHPLFEFINKTDAIDEYGYSRDTNIYCIPWTQCRMSGEFVGSLFANPRSTVKAWQKYTALNLLPIASQGTVEWRHMHGTNNMEKLSKWLNIIGAIMRFSKETDFKDVEKTILTLNDTSAYQQFFDAVLKGTLTYDAQYARQMSNGVICAKYALINKDKKKEMKTAVPGEWLDDDDEPDDHVAQDDAAPARPAGWLEAAMRARVQEQIQAEQIARGQPVPVMDMPINVNFNLAEGMFNQPIDRAVAEERIRVANAQLLRNVQPGRPIARPANRRPVRG